MERQKKSGPRRTKPEEKRQRESQLRQEMGERLRELRFEKGYTQEQMAVFLDITPAFYGRIERGENTLTPEKQKLAVERLDIDMNYLLTGKCTSIPPVGNILLELPKHKAKYVNQIIEGITKLVEE